MITINKNSTNNIVVTVTEKTTVVNPVYLFRFVDDITGKEVVFTTPDISVNTTRYNEFVIVEDVLANQDLFNGIINLLNLGDYTYYIYDITASSPQDLDYTNAAGLVEYGKMVCKDPAQILTTTFNIDDAIDNRVFEPTT